MAYREEYLRKRISVEEAVDLVPSHADITTMGLSAEPCLFLSHLGAVKERGVKDVMLASSLPVRTYDYYADPSYAGVIDLAETFFARFCTELQAAGRAFYIPCHLRNCGLDRIDFRRANPKRFHIYVVAVTPMDRHGYFSTGALAIYNRDMVKDADMVIVEVNENVPRTYGDTYIHISEVDHILEANSPLPYLDARPVSDTDRVIGGHIAQLIEDGSTIQLGIGGIPTALAAELRDKKDLGVHTEMLNDGLVELWQLGVITNRRKTLYPDRIVASFSSGSKELYEFIDENPGVLHLNVSAVNSPYLVSQNDKMVSINTTLQVDLMGQCASEAIGTMQISGIGGQTDTAMGAKLARGGKSIIALHSTAMIKDGEGGRKRISSIQAVHPAGTVISLGRADVDFVVTEYGVAPLRGTTMRERAQRLISIAHPDYRDELTEQARQYHLI